MKKNIKNILKEKIIRINLSCVEIYSKILKSIKQNNNIQNKLKIYTNYKINKINKRNFFLCKKHKVCVMTGKRGGLLKQFNYSRYTIKSLILGNRLSNIKKKNW